MTNVGRWEHGVLPTPEEEPGLDLLTALAFVAIFAVLLTAFNIGLSVPPYGAVERSVTSSLAPSLVLVGIVVSVVLIGKRWAAMVGAIVLTMLVLLIATDVTYSAFYGRPLNIPTDAQILPRSLSTMVQGFPVQAGVGLLMFVVGVLVTFLLARWMLRIALRFSRPTSIAMMAGVSLLGALGSVSMGGPVWQMRAGDTVIGQIEDFAVQKRALPGIREALATDLLEEAGGIAALGDANVHLLFVESYGSFALDEADFLPDFERRLEDAGYNIASGALEAPIIGGRSWLAHGTVLSGVTLKNDGYTPLLYSSGRKTLVDLFGDAGYRAVAVGPSVRRPWSENGFFRFDTVLNFWDLDYQGPSYGALDIPDQVTMKRIDDLVLKETEKPLFLVAPLLSSHWPWTVVPKRLEDWDAIDRGQALGMMSIDAMKTAQIEDMPQMGNLPPFYMPTLEYSISSIVDYAVNAVAGEDLLIVLGDHPPAAFVTEDSGARGVPIHVLSRNPAHLERFLARGFVAGMVPDAAMSLSPMRDVPRWLTGQSPQD